MHQKLNTSISALILGLVVLIATLTLLSGPSGSASAEPAPATTATTYYVAPGADCGTAPGPCYSTIQAAVDAASPGDEIRVATGTYTDVHARPGVGIIMTDVVTQVVYLDKSVTIRGSYTVDDWDEPDTLLHPTTLDAQSQGRGMVVVGEVNPTVEGLNVRNGAGRNGGAMIVLSGTVTISDSWLYNNSAHWSGGGLFLDHGVVTFHASRVSNNAAANYYGGGLYLDHATATFVTTYIYENTTRLEGAGLNVRDSSVRLIDSSVSDNTSTNVGYGGGLSVRDSTIALTNTVVYRNGAVYAGGLYLRDSSGTFFNNRISANLTRAYGGGIALSYSTATIISNTITENSVEDSINAGCFGGGVYANTSDLQIISNTITFNSVACNGRGWGGGLNINHSTAVISDNIISHNTCDSTGGGLYVGAYRSEDSSATVRRNKITHNTAGKVGGGAYLTGNAIAFDRNWILGNTARDGGGLYLNSSGRIKNNVVADNQATLRGSGIFVSGLTSRLYHTTIARNHGGDGSGVHVGRLTTGLIELVNTILVSHTVGVTATEGVTVQMDATLYHLNGTNWGGPGTVLHTDDYAGDPAFIPGTDAAYVHIGSASAAIDKGTDVGVTVDIDGDPRPYGEGFDLGADEYANPAALRVSKRAHPYPAHPGEPLTYTIRVTNTGEVGLHATITDVLPAAITPAGTLVWTPVITLIDPVWTQTVVVTVTAGYSGYLTNVVRVATEEGATGVYTDVSATPLPALQVFKSSAPALVRDSAPLIYTIRVVNTGNVSLHATVTDTLPAHVTPTGPLTWTPTLATPGTVWTHPVTVTVEPSYTGPLTNVVRATSIEGATDAFTHTLTVRPVTDLYLPTVLRNGATNR